MNKLFSAQAKGQRVNAGAGTGAVSVALGMTGASVRVVNHGPDDAYFAIGDGQQVAKVPQADPEWGCVAVLANSDITLGIASSVNPLQFATRTEAGTAVLDVYVSTGI
ncbi:hypothetical protein [Massilia sp. DD77]|uniref:hypothetical protein n=1 Tax=Massilia sp. DD77 TaxID=3109349 RepID=UPI0030002D4C